MGKNYWGPDGEPTKAELETLPETMHYPLCCQSMYCGKTGDMCRICELRHVKDKFVQWRRLAKAVQLDPIWSPTLWTSTILEEARK